MGSESVKNLPVSNLDQSLRKKRNEYGYPQAEFRIRIRIFGSLDPDPQIFQTQDYDPQDRKYLKPWIQIRLTWMQIRNPAQDSSQGYGRCLPQMEQRSDQNHRRLDTSQTRRRRWSASQSTWQKSRTLLKLIKINSFSTYSAFSNNKCGSRGLRKGKN